MRIWTGLGIPLRNLAARAAQREGDPLRFLVDPQVQIALESILASSAASSLIVERAFAETKRSEAPRLCHVSTAGRNQILRQFLRQRGDLLQKAEAAAASLRRSNATNLQSLAWERQPEMAGAAAGDPAARAALKRYIDAHRLEMQEELKSRREVAKAAVDRASSHTMPVSEGQWIEWFREHYDTFYSDMSAATQERRRMNQRLCTREDTPLPVARLGPKAKKVQPSDLPLWQQLLLGRTGWYAVQEGPGSVRTMFLFVFHRMTYAMEIDEWAEGGQFRLRRDLGARLGDILKLLVEVEIAQRPGMGVFELYMKAKAVPGAVLLKPQHAQAVTAPLAPVRREPKKKQKAAAASARQQEAAASGARELSEDSGSDSAASRPKKDACGSASDSSRASVDTEVESGVEDWPSKGGGPESAESDIEEAADGLGTEAAGAEDGLSEEELASKKVRHPPGTWTTWDSSWFYITKTKGFTDVKCWIKAPLRRGEHGMGAKQMSKTLTPAHYGDSWENPWRSMLLLQAWAVYRSGLNGWADKRPARVRERALLRSRLEKELRTAHGDAAAPLLGSQKAHDRLREWVPDLVASMVA